MKNTWDDIFSYWKLYCSELDARILNDNYFQKIYVKDTKSSYKIGATDWWPANELNDRAKSLKEKGILGVNWETPIGIIRTAEMFWDYKRDEEKRALIWIAASLIEMKSYLPYEWRGETYKLITGTYGTVVSEMNLKEMWRWHSNTKNTLPNGLVSYTDIIKKPEDLNDLIEIIAVENTYTFATWSLVNITS